MHNLVSPPIDFKVYKIMYWKTDGIVTGNRIINNDKIEYPQPTLKLIKKILNIEEKNINKQIYFYNFSKKKLKPMASFLPLMSHTTLQYIILEKIYYKSQNEIELDKNTYNLQTTTNNIKL